jgi:hypothetical protein
MQKNAQEVLDKYAEGIDARERARRFLEQDRWLGDDPVLLLTSAAATSTGQEYSGIVKPKIEEFREKFIETGRVSSYEDLSRLEMDDQELNEIFSNQRKKKILIEGARQLHDPDMDDSTSLKTWARNAQPSNYQNEKIGSIHGVGLRTFQYLRMLAGVDTLKPDIKVKRFLREIAPEVDIDLGFSGDLEALEKCNELAASSDYRVIEVDQIAWWYETDIEDYEL